MPLKGQAKIDNDRRYYLENQDKIKKQTREYALKNKDRTKYCKQASFCRKKLKDSDMTADVIQMVYEDNIKKNGTLTCVVCHKRIDFGQDTLEHDIPLSRGGTHDYCNLGVAHRSCNSSKHTKTLEEMS